MYTWHTHTHTHTHAHTLCIYVHTHIFFWMYKYPVSMRRSEELVTQLCLTLCDPMDCSLSDFFIHGTFQARTLQWVATSSSRGSSRTRDQTWVSLHWQADSLSPCRLAMYISYILHKIKIWGMITMVLFLKGLIFYRYISRSLHIIWWWHIELASNNAGREDADGNMERVRAAQGLMAARTGC